MADQAPRNSFSARWPVSMTRHYAAAGPQPEQRHDMRKNRSSLVSDHQTLTGS